MLLVCCIIYIQIQGLWSNQNSIVLYIQMQNGSHQSDIFGLGSSQSHTYLVHTLYSDTDGGTYLGILSIQIQMGVQSKWYLYTCLVHSIFRDRADPVKVVLIWHILYVHIQKGGPVKAVLLGAYSSFRYRGGPIQHCTCLVLIRWLPCQRPHVVLMEVSLTL